MKRLSIEPRPPINQGIDVNNATVLRHTAIYNGALSTITEGMQTVGLMVNPFSTAPLSGYLGIWSPTSNPIRVQISNDIGAIPVDYSFAPELGRNLISLLGLIPNALNHLTVTIPGVGTASGEIITTPLPPTDAVIPADPDAERFTGFPVIEVTKETSMLPEAVNHLYFTAFYGRYNVGVDPNGTVRWYTTLDIPSFNFERLSNGHFISAGGNFDENKLLYEFDMVGRVHAVYILDNQCHHSIYQLSNGNILIPSESTGTSIGDGVSIVDLNTGLETAYYDMREVIDTGRTPRPGVAGLDWLHINQSYLNTTNNLVISSGRQQGSVIAVDADTSDLVFILGNREDWENEFQSYLLTPVDDAGAPLYDFSDPNDIDRADKEFWQWGQHAVMEISNTTKGTVELLLFDNGNFRSRDVEKAMLPNDNYSRIVHYKIDIENKTVIKKYEYGRFEVGNRGYSSFVSNQQILADGNYMINFGGVIVDENGRISTVAFGGSDIEDPLVTDTIRGIVIIQEIDPATNELLLELTCTSGRYKNPVDDGDKYITDFYSFRAHKLPMLP